MSALLDGWAAGLFVGLILLPLVVVLFMRVLQPIGEIRRYADDVLEAGLGIARNVDGLDEVVRTRELATALPGLATAFLANAKKERP